MVELGDDVSKGDRFDIIGGLGLLAEDLPDRHLHIK
jgi:hypothetical protein